MNYYIEKYTGVRIELSALPIQNGAADFHVMAHADTSLQRFSEQVNALRSAFLQLFRDKLPEEATVVFARCFLSDAANQQKQAQESFSGFLGCTVSYVQQPPLNGGKIAFWLHLQTDVTRHDGDGWHLFERNGFTHCFTSASGTGEDSRTQTRNLLEEYERQLNIRDCRMADNCLRTWLFTRDIDTDYAGMASARKEHFARNGLTRQTHYIASTGIEGRDADASVKVKMDTYWIRGLEEEQVQFLYAKDRMSPTHQYGITFERGVSIDFGDRRNVHISGTASIDRNGNVLYVNDVRQQTLRMWENVEALLHEADCGFGDLMQVIVYLRDFADYATVKPMFDKKFPETPVMMVLAPICRTQWLIEMECIAAKPVQHQKFRNY
ncbi:MAG: hypothetical protein LBE91_18800 [Tannerella sp.]|jgi:enamine deaminase RidA (YjgF/YER057c/UK114 family)|nr:hypothetical protein [Tannerella sp.]